MVYKKRSKIETSPRFLFFSEIGLVLSTNCPLIFGRILGNMTALSVTNGFCTSVLYFNLT